MELEEQVVCGSRLQGGTSGGGGWTFPHALSPAPQLCWDPLPESPPVPISGPLCPLLLPPPNPSALATAFDQSETLSRQMS